MAVTPRNRMVRPQQPISAALFCGKGFMHPRGNVVEYLGQKWLVRSIRTSRITLEAEHDNIEELRAELKAPK